MPGNSKNEQQGPKEAMPFEEALKKLESLVESMEAEELPLETLLSRYTEGANLVKVCQAKLAEAELKLQRLEKSPSGETTLKAWAPEESGT